ncbi:MAG: hypothetical protein ACLSGS_09625 [Adlercreutzia sp.]
MRVVVQRDAVEVTGRPCLPRRRHRGAGARALGRRCARVWAPTVGWSVAGVTVDGVALPGETVTAGQVTLPRVSASHQVKATFLKNAYAVAATVRDGAGATAAVTDAAGAPVSAVPHGEGCTFSWQAEPGWRVSDILVNGKSVALTGLFAVADAGQWVRRWKSRRPWRGLRAAHRTGWRPGDAGGGRQRHGAAGNGALRGHGGGCLEDTAQLARGVHHRGRRRAHGRGAAALAGEGGERSPSRRWTATIASPWPSARYRGRHGRGARPRAAL